MTINQTLQNLAKLDWPGLIRQLWEEGFAVSPAFVSDEVRNTLKLEISLNKSERPSVEPEDGDNRIWSGRYLVFQRPLPMEMERLQQEFYQKLLPVAHQWSKAMKIGTEYPSTLADYRLALKKRGQEKSLVTGFVLRSGDFVGLHQDLFGPMVFPYQVLLCLSEKGLDYDGGELRLLFRDGAGKSRTKLISAPKGGAVIFPSATRPVCINTEGERVLHGVDRVLSGERVSLALIFHGSSL